MASSDVRDILDLKNDDRTIAPTKASILKQVMRER